MLSIVFRFFACLIAVPVCAIYMPGVHMSDLYGALLAGGVLGLIHIILRPGLKLMLGAFNILTLGLLSVFIDTWIVLLAIKILPGTFSVDSIWWALAVSVAVNIVREFLAYIFGNR